MHSLTTQLEGRLVELRGEFENGQKALYACQNREMELKEMLLRISGAIQVLEEELTKANNIERAAADENVAKEVERNGRPQIPV